MFRFSRTRISPPGPSSGVPETAKRPAVQRGGLGAAFAVGTPAATNVAASANSRNFEPLDMTVSWRPRGAMWLGPAPPAPVEWARACDPVVEAERGRVFHKPGVPKALEQWSLGLGRPQQAPYVRGAEPDASWRPSPRRQGSRRSGLHPRLDSAPALVSTSAAADIFPFRMGLMALSFRRRPGYSGR